ncbi:RNA-guided endonuclease InsQ/TnpB family protein [Baaleninema simplex]|uniref:RNA-guided endonuclease InsQ/TnpB family protein n=1 Tax=Baaleninema simplex TaxID=2862350 RepID=UPI00034781C3|nr:RNA-guided endonuclease TnpB family protein [Baaleninema simplex]
MEQILTVVCQLKATAEQSAALLRVAQAFAAACNLTNSVVRPAVTSKTTIQSLVYRQLRESFGLSANLAVRACARVAANRKTAKAKGREVNAFKPTSVDYDARVFSFREDDWTVSLSTTSGRVRVPIVAAPYQKGKLSEQKPTSAQLCKHRDGLYYLHIQVKRSAPEMCDSQSAVGVDLGRRDIAVTSKGQRWNGKDIQEKRDKYARVRASLQKKASKGTRSTRRRARQVLKRLSGKERRYQQWLNHNISRQIVDFAKQQGLFIAIEDLSGIRERTNQQPRNQTERRRSNSWAFYQLRQFLSYKGITEGVLVLAVPPAYSSQTCHHCLHIHPVKGKSYRQGKTFRCGNCGWLGDADDNGSKVIELIGVAVNRPGGSGLFCSLRATESHLSIA